MPDNDELPLDDGLPANSSEAVPSCPPGISDPGQKDRLSPELKEVLLATMPSPEERERLYRALQGEGGLSSQEFLTQLGLEGDRRS